MKLKVQYLLFCLVLHLGCVQKTTPIDNSEKEIIKTEILLMFENYHNAIKKDGLTAEFKFLDDSDNFYWVPPGYHSALSYDSVKSILNQNSKSIQHIEFEFETISIYPLHKEFATYTGIVVGKMTDTTQQTSQFKIIESGSLIKRDTRWKILNGQSRNLPTDNN